MQPRKIEHLVEAGGIKASSLRMSFSVSVSPGVKSGVAF